jgi:hypothetical protein
LPANLGTNRRAQRLEVRILALGANSGPAFGEGGDFVPLFVGDPRNAAFAVDPRNAAFAGDPRNAPESS